MSGFVTAFCTGCIALGALYILVPSGNISKAVKYAFALSFLCLVIFSAFKISNISLPEFSTENRDFGDEKMSAATAQIIFSEALTHENINFIKITVFTDKSETGGISISKVLVYTAEPYEKVYSVIGSDAYSLVVINE